MSESLSCPKCGASYLREEGSSGIRLCPNPRCQAPVDANPPRPVLTLALPDSLAMRTLLDYMATLAKEDEIEHWEGELEEAEREGDHKKAEKAKAMIGAYDDFWEVVTKTLHPEVLEQTQESINSVVAILSRREEGRPLVSENSEHHDLHDSYEASERERMFKVGDTLTFKTPFEQYRQYDGLSCQVKRVIDTPDEEHDAEVLPMYEVEILVPHVTIEAWPEELVRPS